MNETLEISLPHSNDSGIKLITGLAILFLN
uniref:Uncharacterized protein n=1 Tax=Arundo donax TaxID=35708 RepID=A0A0A9AVG8_ARUDO